MSVAMKTAKKDALPPMPKWRVKHMNGALLEAPIYEKHYRGSNWLAVIDVDGTCPGGLSRKFLPYAKGDCIYMIEQVRLFDALEFAADYTTSVGKKKPSRCYVVVMAITPTEMMLQEYETGAEACLAAQAARTSPDERVRSLEVTRAEHLATAKRIEDEISALKGAT